MSELVLICRFYDRCNIYHVVDMQAAVGFKPKTTIEDGLQQFMDWYVEYYGKK
ncbi:hypothetical protein FLK61_38955 [Paenalkalicoccus suaedae]|uniref:NAD(P)-binding domain-containing protein n=1 Tax=Paenalkalicoccus suaedae TaxID=2592382 RepID=A0A859FAR3_9BACI|nr:hypothetical protein [Paenalkalicoccus suaedae]QKS69594.1 hypothetical protein FLK61_38955 [Paenalkalicoccus suaedae]